MNKPILIIVACCIACAIAACSKKINKELAQSRNVSQQLGEQLKSKLIDAMQAGGPENALLICKHEAIKVSTENSKQNNLEVGRTSLKLRNFSNQADDWEIKQLTWFKSQKLAGSDIKSLEVNEITEENGKNIFRYMKAIPIQEPCLVCHGKTLAPSIEAKIKNLYPQDQATGYELGEIRGAFTVKLDL